MTALRRSTAASTEPGQLDRIPTRCGFESELICPYNAAGKVLIVTVSQPVGGEQSGEVQDRCNTNEFRASGGAHVTRMQQERRKSQGCVGVKCRGDPVEFSAGVGLLKMQQGAFAFAGSKSCLEAPCRWRY